MTQPKLSKTQRDVVAKAMAQGNQSLDAVASLVNLSPQALQQWAESDTALQERARYFRGKEFSVISDHRYRFFCEGLPKATTQVLASLDSDSESIRLQTSQYLIGRCIPQPAQQHEHEHKGTVSAAVSEELESALVNISDTLTELRANHNRNSALSRVREGADALPSPGPPLTGGDSPALSLPAELVDESDAE